MRIILINSTGKEMEMILTKISAYQVDNKIINIKNNVKYEVSKEAQRFEVIFNGLRIVNREEVKYLETTGKIEKMIITANLDETILEMKE